MGAALFRVTNIHSHHQPIYIARHFIGAICAKHPATRDTGESLLRLEQVSYRLETTMPPAGREGDCTRNGGRAEAPSRTKDLTLSALPPPPPLYQLVWREIRIAKGWGVAGGGGVLSLTPGFSTVAMGLHISQHRACWTEQVVPVINPPPPSSGGGVGGKPHSSQCHNYPALTVP